MKEVMIIKSRGEPANNQPEPLLQPANEGRLPKSVQQMISHGPGERRRVPFIRRLFRPPGR